MTPPDDDASERTTFLPAGWATQTPASAEPMGHYLVGIGGAVVNKRVEIADTPVTMGRNPQQTLVFANDSDVSRVHARVSLVNGAIVVEDLGSTNGTYIDDVRLTRPTPLREGNVLRVGHQQFKYERRSKVDVARSQDLDRGLLKANRYVQSLLPERLVSGAVRADWRFEPCAHLGGDAFGYYWLDPETFIFYLVDVSGHGVGSAMHSVTVLNVLRQRALPNVNFEKPAEVLASLNDRFTMDQHSGMYFTMWYGVYRATERRLAYATAGHHAAYLVAADRQTSQPLGMSALMIGAIPNQTYDVQETVVAPGSSLYLFSDGVFEIIAADERQWSLADFLPLLVQPPVAGTGEADRLYQAVRAAARPGPLDDDFSLMVLTFS